MRQGSYQLAWPPLTPGVKALLILYVVCFVVHPLFSGSMGTRAFITEHFYISNAGMLGRLNLWQPLTYQLFHADFFHILFNSFVLYIFGAEVEQRWSAREFVIFTLGSGVGVAVLATLWYLIAALLPGILINPSAIGPEGWVTTQTVGASGAINAIIAAYCLYMWNTPRPLLLGFSITGKWLLAIFFGFDLLRAFAGSNVSLTYHILGTAVGLLATIVVYQPLGLIGRFKLWRLRRKLVLLRGDGPTTPDLKDFGSGGSKRDDPDPPLLH